MIPIGTCLPDRKSISVSRSWLNRRKTHIRDAIVGRRNKQPVPVDRGRCGELVRHIDDCGITLIKPKDWSGNIPVDGHSGTGFADKVDLLLSDCEVVVALSRGEKKKAL